MNKPLLPFRQARWIVPLLLVVAVAARGYGEEAPLSPPIRIALYADEGAASQGSPHLKDCLSASLGYEFELVTADDIRRGVLDRFDVVIHPGGSGSRQGNALGAEGRDKVRQFVADGGGFVGICAGAYLASAQYSWSLGLIDAIVVDRQHWARGRGDVELRLTSAGREWFGVDDDFVTVWYAQGPLLAPAENEEIPDYESVALYETEIAKKGAPTGVMIGTTAIARSNFGDGRAVAISPHPEKTPGREDSIRAAVRWAAGIDTPPAAAGAD